MRPAILFDLDRTLVDAQTQTDYRAALADVRAMIGNWPDVSIPETEWDHPTVQCMAALVALNGDERWTAVSDAIERHELATASMSAAMPGLTEALTATADTPRAVVTLLAEHAARAILDQHHIEIDILIPRRAAYRPKPAPDQVVQALDVLGTSAASAVFIGDSSWDAEAARSADVRFLGVTNDGTSVFPSGVDTYPNLLTAVLAALGGERAGP